MPNDKVDESNSAELLKELHETKQLLAQREEELGEVQELLKAGEGQGESLKRYQEYVGTRYNEAYDGLPDYLKTHITKEDFESDPLSGLNFIGTFTSVIADVKKNETEKEDPTSKKVDKDNNKSALSGVKTMAEYFKRRAKSTK